MVKVKEDANIMKMAIRKQQYNMSVAGFLTCPLAVSVFVGWSFRLYLVFTRQVRNPKAVVGEKLSQKMSLRGSPATAGQQSNLHLILVY